MSKKVNMSKKAWLSYNVDSTLVKSVLIPSALEASVLFGQLTVTLKPDHEPVNIRFLTKSNEVKELTIDQETIMVQLNGNLIKDFNLTARIDPNSMFGYVSEKAYPDFNVFSSYEVSIPGALAIEEYWQ